MNEYYQAICEHKEKTYQSHEFETNAKESYSCNDCAKELPLPQEDDLY